MEQSKGAAFVLVAGGLGERLGYSGIKVALPTDLARNACFLQVGFHPALSAPGCCYSISKGQRVRRASRYIQPVLSSAAALAAVSDTSCGGDHERWRLQVYIESILALQAKAGGSAQLPLAIMTSGDTHDRTLRLLEDSAYFGMQPGQVTLLKQEKVRTHCLCSLIVGVASTPAA